MNTAVSCNNVRQCSTPEDDGLGFFRGLAVTIYIYGGTLVAFGFAWAIFKEIVK